MRGCCFKIFIASLLLTGCLHGNNDSAESGAAVPGSSGNPSSYILSGVNFSPYLDGQDPNLGATVEAAQLTARLQLLVGQTSWIRTFGSTHGLEETGNIARSLGFETALQAWIDADLATNETELANLIAAGQRGEADILIVGSEVLLRGDLGETQLIEYIDRIKQAVPGIPVATADTYAELLAHPAVIAAGDVVLPNYHPYWEGIAVENAVAAIHGWHQLMEQVAKGKPVMIAETGWPSAGDTQGLAVPTPENAALFFKNFVSWARANQVDYFYFEGFDEAWKEKYEGPQGAHWGIWDKAGNLKPGMNAVFQGETTGDNWSQNTVVGGPGQPLVEFTHVPPRGSFQNLVGRVLHVDPSLYKVAVYIYVSGWWTKPFFSRPLTTIQADGRWVCDITTGGVDERATRIAAYLVPVGYQPPLMSGGGTLPAELDIAAVASIEATR